MTNTLYPLGKQKLLGATIDMDTDTIKVALVAAAADYNAAHEFWSSLSASVIGTPATLASISLTNGVFDAADVTFTAVAGGSTIGSLVIFKDTGVAATSPLIAWIDTDGGGTISVATTGGDVPITWDSGASKIFTL